MRGEERRAVILAAAQREFARTGYHGVSTATIARASSCSEPMLYKHFASKQALFAAALEAASFRIEAQWDTLFAAPGNLLDNWNATLPRIMNDPSYVEMMQLRKLAVTLVDNDDIRATLDGMQRRLEERVDGALLRGKGEGWLREEVTSEYVSWMWLGILWAGCLREATEPHGFAKMLPIAQTFIEGLRPLGA
ncbi:MAG: TetR/AcrR family transcriptional regulator [Thermoleophilia bacterium]|jgi:AcrR family transcriptional regulator|nr:TetR/AcrR family transcriptional regulator [Thermoleophilia bacterium]